MRSHRSNQEKKRLLGEHIFSELLTHSDFGGESNVHTKNFADGGQVATLRAFLAARLATLRKELRVQQNKVARLKRQSRAAEGFGGAVNRVFGENPVIEQQDLTELQTEHDQVQLLLDGIKSGDVMYSGKGFVNGKGQVIAGQAEMIAENPVYYAQRYAAYKQAATSGLEMNPPVLGTDQPLTRQQREERAVAEGRAEYLSSRPKPATTGSDLPVATASTDQPTTHEPFGIATPEASKPLVTAFQKEYNGWAKANGLVTIQEDGMYGPVTKRAMDNWNLNKPAWEQVSPVTGSVIDPNTGKTTENLVGIRRPDEITKIENRPEFDTSNRLQDGLDKTRQALENRTALQQAANVQSPKAGISPWERQNLFANLTDLAKAGVGALVAYKNPVPTYRLPDSYSRMQNELYAARNQGFSPEQRAAINQGLQNNYAANVSAIRNIAGGGVAQGAVLAALGRASAGLDSAYLDTAIQDVQLKRANYANHQNAVLTGLNIDRQLFEQDKQAAIAQRQAGLSLLDSALNNMAARQQYDSQFGPGTLYDQLQTEQIRYLENQRQAAGRLPDVYMQWLNESANQKR
ncbi:hypothetical protein [Dyadobacter sp. BHUBP1]|uniref:hypothetical protein n=1 Tax=Dyadobacter sp. BHUBP1 TaxID=3424178 RepID=UPI003D34B56F